MTLNLCVQPKPDVNTNTISAVRSQEHVLAWQHVGPGASLGHYSKNVHWIQCIWFAATQVNRVSGGFLGNLDTARSSVVAALPFDQGANPTSAQQ